MTAPGCWGPGVYVPMRRQHVDVGDFEGYTTLSTIPAF